MANQSIALNTVAGIAKAGLGVPFLLLALMAMMVLPLPPFFLDISFSFNIAFSIIVLLAVIYTQRPLDFAVFPTVILVATLLRLALNIASTRVVLLNGHTGSAAAGDVIEAFGEVVIGGNYAVGLVVFTILIVINFVVITKGSGRVSEVSARFTLDAMPGKQMAIDADLNAGIIDQNEARARREEVAQEADFYGSMDGASKFVRGDAIAGILILIINILGGLGIGILQHGLSFQQALENYILLTIGDGLVAQIPSLFLSTAAAIMVTRMSKAHDVSQQIVSQLLGNSKIFYISACILFGFGIVPGMPHVPFIALAALLGFAGYQMNAKQRRQIELDKEAQERQQTQVEPSSRELTWGDVMPVDAIGLEVGYRLIPLVDTNQGGQLMSRIKGIRKKISQEIGFLIPSVHIRDNLDLSPHAYRISLMGVTMAEDMIYPDLLLAINPGKVFGELEGTHVSDPAFSLPAVWIAQNSKEQAQTYGYTVVDPSTVIATHISQIIQSNAHTLLGYEEAQKLLDNLAESAPKLVEQLIPDTISLGILVKILQNLLEESVPIKDIRTIAESIAEYGAKIKDPNALTIAVRVSLRRLIIQSICGAQQEIPIVTLSPQLEQLLQKSLKESGTEQFQIEPGLANRIITSTTEIVNQQELLGRSTILLVSAEVRRAMALFLRPVIKGLNVLSYMEIPEDKQIQIVGTITEQEQ